MKSNQYRNYKSLKGFNNKENISNVDKTFFDKLFYRIFLSSLVLLTYVGMERIFNYFTVDFNLSTYLMENINFIKVIKKFNNTIYKFIDDDLLIDVYSVDFYSNVSYYNGVNQVKLENSNSVNNLVSGYVVKIEKNDDLYSVTIKGIDGLEYQFIGLTSIDIIMYQYLEAGQIIGVANFDKVYGIYFFDLIIKDKEEVFSYFEKAN